MFAVHVCSIYSLSRIKVSDRLLKLREGIKTKVLILKKTVRQNSWEEIEIQKNSKFNNISAERLKVTAEIQASFLTNFRFYLQYMCFDI